MTFAELKAALQARGFESLSDTDLGRLVNDAASELDELERWPYREASVTGTAPLAVSDLGEVEAVFNTDGTDTQLVHKDYGTLVWQYDDLSTTGDPVYWYRADPLGVPSIATYPASTSVVIGVQYWKIAAEMGSAGDEPAAPDRFHRVILDIAARMAESDRNNYGAASALQAGIDRRLVAMRSALLGQQGQTHVLPVGDDC